MMTMFSEIISVKSREENLLSCARKSFQRVSSVFNSEVVEVMMFSRYERYFRTLWAQKRRKVSHKKLGGAMDSREEEEEKEKHPKRDENPPSREEEEEDGAMSITKKPIVPPLHAAAREGDLESLSKLLASHSSPTNNNNNNTNHIINERDMHGRTAIHLASWANEKAIVERLLDFGADVTVGAADGVQAIHFACMKGHLGIVKTLLSRERTNRANVRAKTSKNENCMHFAVKSGNKELVEYLAKKNVSVLLKSAKRKYAADMTNKREIKEIVERLKETQEKEEEEKKKRKKKREEGDNNNNNNEDEDDVVVAEDDAVVLEAAAGPMLPPHLMTRECPGTSDDENEKEDEEKMAASKKKRKKETKPPIMGLSFGEEDE